LAQSRMRQAQTKVDLEQHRPVARGQGQEMTLTAVV
jgi:hypothetical protein